MTYECVECGRKIAEDARRCPGCGTKDAGERARLAWELNVARISQEQAAADKARREAELDRTDPGWRERKREEEARAAAQAAFETRQAKEVAEAAQREREAQERSKALWSSILDWTCYLGGAALGAKALSALIFRFAIGEPPASAFPLGIHPTAFFWGGILGFFGGVLFRIFTK